MNLLGKIIFVSLALFGFLAAPAAQAHDARPAYLEINEASAGRYEVLWRTPLLSGQRLPVGLVFPAETRNIVEPVERVLSDSVVERRVVDFGPDGISGKRLDFPGLQMTLSDVLVRVTLRDGTNWTELVKPGQPWIEMRARKGLLAITGAYVSHGMRHILMGFDHLLFVFALMLIVRKRPMLVKTITSFTIAHSITLGLATLGVIHVPAPPVEATIALSIMLLATEIACLSRGRPSLTSRFPWAVAFCFGLLHGLGFAGALTEIGLPQGDVPLALLSFNVGVELGQLSFVAAVLAAYFLVMKLPLPGRVVQYARPVAYYAIGTLSAFWFFDRLSGFWF
jgi:hydrogenase/urease accessory protein HupE